MDRKVLIIVENLPVPFDTRVWQEATTLAENGYTVSVEAKFGRKSGLLYKSQLWLERQTYRHCKFAFVTNESYKEIAIERGGMKPEDVIVLRSGPKLERLRIVPARPEIKRGKKYMVG